MSRIQSFEVGPLYTKADKDLRYLCYLGLHQYAKENKLIGRSRPMITDDMTHFYIKRLFFRLTVACIKQLIGATHWDHGDDREEQVNYLNVDGYKTLRLYGLLDKDLFVRSGEHRNYGRRSRQLYWPTMYRSEDMEWLIEPVPQEVIYEHLSVQGRALFDVAGEIFAHNYREVARSLPGDHVTAPDETTPAYRRGAHQHNRCIHLQWDPNDSHSIKNIAINLKLYENKYTGSSTMEIPVHIEKILYFRRTIMPWIQSLRAEELKESYQYCVSNMPLQEVIADRVRAINNSEREQRRVEEREEAAAESRENELEHLRGRMQAHFGRGPGREMAGAEATEIPGITVLGEGEAAPEDAEEGAIVQTIAGHYFRFTGNLDWERVQEVVCPHCDSTLGPRDGDSCACTRMQRMYGRQGLETIFDDPNEEDDDCHLCEESHDNCQCCYACENHIEQCTCEEDEDEVGPLLEREAAPQPDVHHGQLAAYAALHARLRAPQPECPCTYCAGYRTGEGEEDGD